jgi:hypothetical protein
VRSVADPFGPTKLVDTQARTSSTIRETHRARCPIPHVYNSGELRICGITLVEADRPAVRVCGTWKELVSQFRREDAG